MDTPGLGLPTWIAGSLGRLAHSLTIQLVVVRSREFMREVIQRLVKVLAHGVPFRGVLAV